MLVLGSGVRARLSSLTLGLSGGDSADSDENSARHFPLCFTFSKWEDVKAELQAPLKFNGALEHNVYRWLPWNATAVNVSSPNAAEEIKYLNCILPFNVVSEKYLRGSSCPDMPDDFQSPVNLSMKRSRCPTEFWRSAFVESARHFDSWRCACEVSSGHLQVIPTVKWSLKFFGKPAGRETDRSITAGQEKSLKTENRVASIERRFSTKILSGLPDSVPFYTGGLWVICFSLLYRLWTVDAEQRKQQHTSQKFHVNKFTPSIWSTYWVTHHSSIGRRAEI